MNNTLKRVTIVLPKNVHAKALETAKAERRNLSKQIQVLIERDIAEAAMKLKQAA
jgi:hypothetical protein